MVKKKLFQAGSALLLAVSMIFSTNMISMASAPETSRYATAVLDQGVLVPGDTTQIIPTGDGSSFAVPYDTNVYTGVKAFYFDSENHEKIEIQGNPDGTFTLPSASRTSDGKVYAEPLRKQITVTLQQFQEKGKYAGADLTFLKVDGAVFNSAGRLTGYTSATPVAGTRMAASEGDYIYFTGSMRNGYEVKVNMGDHQIVRMEMTDVNGDSAEPFFFFDYDAYAFDKDLDVAQYEKVATTSTGKFSSDYNKDYDSALYNAPSVAHRSYTEFYDIYYVKISADTTCWEEREPVKAGGLDTLRDFSLGVSGSERDVEISLDNDTLSPFSAVAVIDTDNNNRDNMGVIEYKGFSTADKIDGVSGRIMTNWVNGTYAKDNFHPAGWAEGTRGAAQFRCGESVQIKVLGDIVYKNIVVSYTDNAGNTVSIPSSTRAARMYMNDGVTQYSPAETANTWYFTIPMVTVRDHLKINVSFVQ